jgi:NitT/TauT family transport system substrate-binding protein
VLYRAVVAALKEATRIVNTDKTAAAALWIEDSKSKLPLDMVGRLVAGSQVRWTMAPENTMKYADFMAEVGTLKTKASAWKDYFFPEIYDENGS